MTPQQMSLLPAPRTRGSARKTDPDTAREAARSMEGHLRDQQALVLRAVAERSRRGLDSTPFEVWDLIGRRFLPGPKENVVSKRLSELREAGMVRLTGETRPGSSRRKQQVWAMTDAGRAWAAERWAS